jgi:hypothetical protein
MIAITTWRYIKTEWIYINEVTDEKYDEQIRVPCNSDEETQRNLTDQ